MPTRYRPRPYSGFPIWQQPTPGQNRRSVWVMPVTGANSQLRKGQFKDARIDGPLVGPGGRPPVWGSEDGAVMVDVRIGDEFRRVEMTCKLKAGEMIAAGLRVNFELGPLTDLMNRPASGALAVHSILCTHLEALMAWPHGPPWMKAPDPKIDPTAQRILAMQAWDAVLATMRPRPLRYQAANNPTLWVVELYEGGFKP